MPLEKKILNLQSLSVHHLHRLLLHSLRPRVFNIPKPPGQLVGQTVRIAVLFSGGLDCTILARLIHDILPPDAEIDLLNVAFENPRAINAAARASQLEMKKKASSAPDDEHDMIAARALEVAMSCYELCPDRQTGRKAFKELSNVCAGRVWRFVAVSVTCFIFFNG